MNEHDLHLQPFEPATWRLLIEDAPRSGPANMAVDHAIAEACAAGESLPTLRFYRWQPPAISLGRHQPLADIDLNAVAAHGYDIVRRTTGGRAILHADELTYSVAAPKDEPRVQGGVMDAYLRLSNALVAGLHLLGVPADKAGADTKVSKDVSAACFEVPSAYEITVAGRKLMGSAQSRRAGYVLQHGSLPLFGDITRLVAVLNLPADQRNLLAIQLAQRACTLDQALDGADTITFEQVVQAMQEGFEQLLNLHFKPAQLTPQETRRTAELLRKQYANPAWTQVR